ncbi:hypothetical protein [Novosphingobium sp. ST904]|nr:hypothetical protein [Novosphingobium sp. ST904]
MNVLYSHIFPAYREYAELTDEARIDCYAATAGYRCHRLRPRSATLKTW